MELRLSSAPESESAQGARNLLSESSMPLTRLDFRAADPEISFRSTRTTARVRAPDLGACTRSLYWPPTVRGSLVSEALQDGFAPACPRATSVRNFPRLSTIPRFERVKQDVPTMRKRSENG